MAKMSKAEKFGCNKHREQFTCKSVAQFDHQTLITEHCIFQIFIKQAVNLLLNLIIKH